MFKSSLLKQCVFSLLFSFFALSSAAVYALDEDQQKVADLIAEDDAPFGVVFELIGNEGDYLLHAIKKVEIYKIHHTPPTTHRATDQIEPFQANDQTTTAPRPRTSARIG